MLTKSRSKVGTIIAVIVATAILGTVAWGVVNRQFVLDQLAVWSFTPSSDVATISQRSGLSDRGKFYFYASQPAIEDAQVFNQNCARQETGSAILGCYTNSRIYVYNVTNAQLNGVEEVTAAHETLHAIWERMNDTDKKTIGDLLESAYTKINDPKLNERMAYYSRTEPGERINELHSILGTEYANLGSELEAHYAEYFSDRQKVVTLHASYQSVFDTLKAQSDALATELATMKKSIDTKTSQYNTEAASISSAVEALKASAASVDRTNASAVNAYNAKRQALFNRLDALDGLRVQINNETDAYNTKVTEYNKLVVSANELNQSLDSTLKAAPSL